MSDHNKIILEISTVVQNLTLKLESLQAKVDELCKSTGDCACVKTVNKKLISEKNKSKN